MTVSITIEQLIRPAMPGRAVEPLSLQDREQVLPHRETLEHAGVLAEVAHPGEGMAVHRQRGDVAPVEGHAPPRSIGRPSPRRQAWVGEFSSPSGNVSTNARISSRTRR